jgi:hypothetical protein
MHCRSYTKCDCIRSAVDCLCKIPSDSIILVDNPYPSGNNLDIPNQWDICETYHILKYHYGVRFAHLTRNTLHMVHSRREFGDSLLPHAEKMAEIGVLIDCSAAAVDKAIKEQFRKFTKDHCDLLTKD